MVTGNLHGRDDRSSSLSDSDAACKSLLSPPSSTFFMALQRLLAQSEANRAKNQKAVEEKYCYRQAELGIGDCGGLRLIPGMTDSGKQETPQW